MSHIRDRLKQYKDKYSDCYKYAGLYAKVIQDMIEQLQDDLEQDEKENGWIPVSERLPEESDYYMACIYNEISNKYYCRSEWFSINNDITPDGESNVWVKNHDYIKASEKLAEYEDLEEQGLLMRLSDDLNRVLYQINYRWTKCTKYGERKNKCEIYSCERECDSREEYYIAKVDLRYIQIGNYYDRLGKFLFFTREEAEKKLEEMKKNG